MKDAGSARAARAAGAGAPSTPDGLLRHELIGMRTTVAGSSDPGMVGVSGVIVYETKSMFVLETGSGEQKSVPKATSVWSFDVSGTTVRVPGSRIARRPIDRLAAGGRRWA